MPRDMSQPARQTLDFLSEILHAQGTAAVLEEAKQILTAAATVIAYEAGPDRLMKVLASVAGAWGCLDDPPPTDAQDWGEDPAKLAA
jgi:hypothetical protein